MYQYFKCKITQIEAFLITAPKLGVGCSGGSKYAYAQIMLGPISDFEEYCSDYKSEKKKKIR